MFELSEIYPGLTVQERELVSKYPADSLNAYWLSSRAEKICLKIYVDSDTNDESDACRHFIWAGLLTDSFGQKRANEWLEAHESDPRQPNEEKAMDLANNRLGSIAAESLLKKKAFTEEQLLKEYKIATDRGGIVVLAPNNGNKIQEVKK